MGHKRVHDLRLIEYSLQSSRQRKNLRQSVNDAFPGQSAPITFHRIAQRRAFITIDDLEPFCEPIKCPAAALENIFAPHGVRNLLITRTQWITFMQDDFPKWPSREAPAVLNDRYNFLLSKYPASLKTKLGETLRQRWNAALARNPPNTLSTVLRVSALCCLFENMNLPFSLNDFADNLFVFFGVKIETTHFNSFASYSMRFRKNNMAVNGDYQVDSLLVLHDLRKTDVSYRTWGET
jgi:hypothetical protein